jgi:peptide/nickel transport system substrate-binding protein
MTTGDYRHQMRARAYSRRGFLSTAAAGLTSAAFIAACGGGGDGSAVTGDKSGLLVPVADTSKQAHRGGSFKTSVSADTTTFDPHTSVSVRGIGGVYSNLLQLAPGHLKRSDGDVTGDIAESWEWSPDGLQLTLKLRQNVAFHATAPVNGRVLDVGDVAYTWERYKAVGVNRSQYYNALAPDAPVVSVTTPDAKTIVFKLAVPVYTFLFLIATGPYPPVIIPKEAEKFDLNKTAIGSGPWYLSEWVPSSRFVYKCHLNYYDKEHPYLDEVSQPIISEYAQGLAQFRAGNIYEWDVRSDEILATKRQVPELNLYASSMSVSAIRTEYGWKPSPPEKTPFRDERVRQAYSMALDRDVWIDLFFNVSKFRSEGLPIDTRWNTCVIADAFEGWWLDPQGKDFGPNSQYFQHNVAEAKKLLAAAGFPNGVDVESIQASNSTYGIDYPKWIEVAEGMASDAGFRFKTTIVPFAEFGTKYRDIQGKYEGVSYRSLPSTSGDTLERLLRDLSAKIGAVTFTGFDVDGKGTYDGDPYLDDLLLKARREPDKQKRMAAVHDAQRHVGKKQYVMRFPGGASSFALRWPAVKNFRAFQDDQRPNYTIWLDEKEAPIKKS